MLSRRSGSHPTAQRNDWRLKMTTLYHGTLTEYAESIKADGIIHGPVYMTTNRELAEEYVLGNDESGVVIAIELTEGMVLHTDMETLNEDPGIEFALEAGMAVYTESDIDVSGAEYIEVSLD